MPAIARPKQPRKNEKMEMIWYESLNKPFLTPPSWVFAPAWIFLYILIMSVCLFLYSYFKTLAARYLSSAQLYPLSQSGSLILSTMMSAALFHERLNIKCVVGIALSFVALIVINVL